MENRIKNQYAKGNMSGDILSKSNRKKKNETMDGELFGKQR